MDYHSEGYNAYARGCPLHGNPYAEGSSAWRQWRDGWFAASHDPRFI